MNWDAIGAVSEIAGAAGVLVSLLYLAVQIRRYTNAIERESQQSFNQQQNALWSLLLSNTTLNELIKRGESTPDQLSEDEWDDFTKFAFMHMNVWESVFRNYQSQNLDHESFRAWDAGARLVSNKAGYKKFWGINRSAYNDSFVTHVGDYFEEL